VPPGYTSSGSCSATLTAGTCTITNTLESASVGGIVEMQVRGSGSAADYAADSSGGSASPNCVVLAGLAAAALATLTAGAWYARRRWGR
jgi:hypothetical protein